MKRNKALVLALVAIALCAGLLWLVISGILSLVRDDPSGQSLDVATYLSQQWKDYPLGAYLKAENTVIVKGSARVTYDQAAKYGAEAYDEALMDSYVTTAKSIALGLESECGLRSIRVVLEQYSTDQQVIFTVDSKGNIKTCWDEK